MNPEGQRLIIASGNVHKVGEFQSLLKGLGFAVLPATACGGMPDVEENGGSFSANAQIKAEALRTRAPGDAWVMADDSGLEVDALGGAPGVFSARFAGEGADDSANLAKLLDALKDVPEGRRKARFRCVLCLIGPDGRTHFFEGTCEGRISGDVRGVEGFGYDPAFIPEGYSKTFGQLGGSVKERLSHRAGAVDALRRELAKRTGL